MPIVMHMATHNTGSIFNICILNKARFRHRRSMLPIIISSGMTIPYTKGKAILGLGR